MFKLIIKSMLAVTGTVLVACSLMPNNQNSTEVRQPANAANWNDYCTGVADSTDIPGVNYSNPDVIAAAEKLSKVAPNSFYFYSGPLNAYGLTKANGKEKVAATVGAPEGTTNNAHIFLTVLCGEFRDRPTMVKEKINWVNRMNKLKTGKRETPVDLNQNIWSQVIASDYRPYLTMSSKLFDLKRQDEEKNGNRYIKFAKTKVTEQIDYPVEGQTVCETKFIFSELIAKGVNDITNFGEYKKKFAEFQKNCSAEDNDYYYSFRGDSNFKPNSPESNGMIWHSSSVTTHCKSTTEAKKDEKKVSDEDCANYFKSPFQSRWNAAKSGLLTWVMRATKHDAVFENSKSPMFVVPHKKFKPEPYSFKFAAEAGGHKKDFVSEWDWNAPDLGFNAFVALTTNVHDTTYKRLRDAVNRHTDWYASGFDDEMGLARPQAYSPFVATSYVMYASDEFTAPGVTVQAESDGRKHWMFVFKVHKNNWYTTKSIKDDLKVNFDVHWIDETSLGTNYLADKERAWDRLGTPVEGEFDSILYLHNITTGHQISSDGLPQF